MNNFILSRFHISQYISANATTGRDQILEFFGCGKACRLSGFGYSINDSQWISGDTYYLYKTEIVALPCWLLNLQVCYLVKICYLQYTKMGAPYQCHDLYKDNLSKWIS